MTDSTLQVLHTLLADPTRECYGLELSKTSSTMRLLDRAHTRGPGLR